MGLDGSPGLPAPVSELVDRDAEISEVLQLLGSSRLITLTGPGGIGKTRLAIAASRRALADDVGPGVSEFCDGGAFIALADLAGGGSCDSAARAVAAALDISGIGALDGDGEATDHLVKALRKRALLLVLDNCEHRLDVAAKLALRLLTNCRRLTILATSREPLGVPGETVWTVPPLSHPQTISLGRPGDSAAVTMPSLPGLAGVPGEGPGAGVEPTAAWAAQFGAVRLFVVRAQQASRDFRLTDDNARTVASICRRLDGIPLALELAAARVRALSVDEIEARLSDRFALLSGPFRFGETRHRTLRTSVEWSHQLLTGTEQELFRVLSVFSGGWTLQSAEALYPDAMDPLSRLVDKSLVNVESTPMGPRYSMLETIRAYAADELAKSGQTYQIHAAHASYFLNLAESLNPLFYGYDQVRAFSVLDAELYNMRAAGRFFQSDVAYAEQNLRLMAALWDFFCCRCHLAEGIRHARGALAQGDQAGMTEPSTLRARVHLGLGALLELHGDAENSEHALHDAVRTARACGDHATEAYALRILSMNAWLRGDPDDNAAELTAQAQSAADGSGSLWHQAYTAQTMATVRGGTPEGAEVMADVWRVTGETGDRRLLSYLRVITAFHALGGPRRAETIGMLTDAYQDFHMVGDRYGRLLALSTRLIAQVAWEGDPEVTARLIGRCESAYAGMGTGPLTVIEMGIDAATTVTREALGQHRYALAVAEGAKLSWDRLAVALVEDLRNGLAGGDDIPSALDPIAVLESSGTTWRMAANGYGDLGDLSGLSGMGGMGGDAARRRKRVTPVFGADDLATSSVLSAVRTAVSATDAIMIKRSGPTVENARGQHEEPAASKLAAPEGARDGGRRRVGHASGPDQAAGVGVLDLLTRREQEIAGHVAQGLTNRRIAEDLVISERTVDTHVQHILAKLGVANRVQLATLLASRSE